MSEAFYALLIVVLWPFGTIPLIILFYLIRKSYRWTMKNLAIEIKKYS